MSSEEGKLFVGGLNFDTDEQGLEQHFSSFGPISEGKNVSSGRVENFLHLQEELNNCSCFLLCILVVVIKDKETQRSRGFGFITFANPEHASDAMRAMNGEVSTSALMFNDAVSSTLICTDHYKHLRQLNML